MKVSIITICYNNEMDIELTMQSVINQTHQDIEYIIIDGNSSDKTLLKINKYKNHISKIISEPDNGLYDALNKGMKNAKGDIVGLIHAGDLLHDNYVINDVVKHFSKHDLDICYGNSKIINDRNSISRINISPDFSLFHLKTGWMPSHQSIYVKRDLINELGGYLLELYPDSDYEWVVRYFNKTGIKIKKLNRFIIKFRLGGISTANYNKRLKKDFRKRVKLAWELNGLRPPIGIFYTKLMRKIPQFLLAKFYK